jgi:predicted outer membrane repeat protein
VNTQPSGVTHFVGSTVVSNTAGGLGGGISSLGTTSLNHTHVQANKGSGGGGIATGNVNVTLVSSLVSGNIPDNCNPLNTIPGCHN